VFLLVQCVQSVAFKLLVGIFVQLVAVLLLVVVLLFVIVYMCAAGGC